MPPRIAVFCHMFHADLFSEVARYLANIPVPAHLYFSTSTEENRSKLREMFPRAVVEVVPNRGRDIAPKFVTFARIHDGYDYVLHLHTKASSAAWRRHLFEHLIGSPKIVATILNAFEHDLRLGVIAPNHYPPVAPWIRWHGNETIAATLLERMGVELPDKIEFPAGSMFWARPGAIKPILELGLRYEDFPVEPLRTGQTIAHAIERLVFISAVHSGFGWSLVSPTSDGELQIDGPHFTPARPNWAPPRPPHKEGNALTRMARRLRRSYQKRFGSLRHQTH